MQRSALEAADWLVLLVFRVDGRDHALPVADVVQVVRMVDSTPLPQAPRWVSGVINVRGCAIPLIDVRIRLGASRREPDLSTPIVVVGTIDASAGLVVDEVVEVLAVHSEAVSSARGASAAATMVSGVAREGDRLILVLDTDRVCGDAIDLSSASGLERCT